MRQQWVRCDAMSVRYKTSGCEALKIGERELKGVFNNQSSGENFLKTGCRCKNNGRMLQCGMFEMMGMADCATRVNSEVKMCAWKIIMRLEEHMQRMNKDCFKKFGNNNFGVTEDYSCM